VERKSIRTRNNVIRTYQSRFDVNLQVSEIERMAAVPPHKLPSDAVWVRMRLKCRSQAAPAQT
jgi:hypothetical protein